MAAQLGAALYTCRSTGSLRRGYLSHNGREQQQQQRIGPLQGPPARPGSRQGKSRAAPASGAQPQSHPSQAVLADAASTDSLDNPSVGPTGQGEGKTGAAKGGTGQDVRVDPNRHTMAREPQRRPSSEDSKGQQKPRKAKEAKQAARPQLRWACLRCRCCVCWAAERRPPGGTAW